VQGRKLRFRTAGHIARAMLGNFGAARTTDYFFTDDNFADKQWEPIFDALCELREERDIPIRFSMQIATLAHEIPGFVAKAVRAACRQVFIGMESINAANPP
jgi:hypothetical protein